MMKQLLVFSVCIAAAFAWGSWKSGLSVRYGSGLFGAGTDFFIRIPLTVNAAKNSRWVQLQRPEGPLPSLVMYCPSQNDVVVCALYDDMGDVAGIQVGLPEDVTTDLVFDMETQGFTLWSAPANQWGIVRNYWTAQQYFVSEEYLNKTMAERIASRVEGRVLKEQAIWVSSFNGELMRISGKASEIANSAETMFTEQGCEFNKGRHYLYNMTVFTECTSETILPWYPMVDKSTDQLVASAFLTAGKLPISALIKDYFERPTRKEVEEAVPNGSQCVYNLADDPGYVTMHIYYVDSPFLINCINN